MRVACLITSFTPNFSLQKPTGELGWALCDVDMWDYWGGWCTGRFFGWGFSWNSSNMKMTEFILDKAKCSRIILGPVMQHFWKCVHISCHSARLAQYPNTIKFIRLFPLSYRKLEMNKGLEWGNLHWTSQGQPLLKMSFCVINRIKCSSLHNMLQEQVSKKVHNLIAKVSKAQINAKYLIISQHKSGLLCTTITLHQSSSMWAFKKSGPISFPSKHPKSKIC